MAGTLTTTLSLSVVNGAFREDYSIGPSIISQAAIGGGNPGTVDVTTSEGDITISLSTPGMVVIENLDSANYVQYGPKSGGAMIPFSKLKAGEWHKFALDGSVTIRAKADTATVKLRIRAYEA